MSLRVLVAPRFERAIATMEQHYLAQREVHPDAGIRLERFVSALLDSIAPMLTAQPALGRRYLPRRGELSALIAVLARLQVVSRGQPFEIRRWGHEDFELLYAHSKTLLVFVSARNQRQQAFF